MFGIDHCYVTLEDCEYAMQRSSTLIGQPGAQPVKVLPGAYQPDSIIARMV